jgi:hypothetical protein
MRGGPHIYDHVINIEDSVTLLSYPNTREGVLLNKKLKRQLNKER